MTYTPPDVWTWDSESGGKWASLNRPIAGPTHDKDLQKGLDPADKAARVASYARTLMHEVEVIAHSCGVVEPRLLNRGHVQSINARGEPEPI